MSYAPTTILYDVNGNPVDVINDGGVYRLAADANINETMVRLANAGKIYGTSTGLVSFGTTSERAIFLLRNPAGSGKTALIMRAVANCDNVPSDPNILRIYRGPTVTNTGTALTESLFNTAGSASAMTSFRGPTVTSNGTLILVNNYVYYVRMDFDGMYFVRPGEDFLVTIAADLSGDSHSVCCAWAEV